MQTKAVARFIRVPPTKARLVLNLVRGKPVGEALSILQYTHRAAARILEKVLRSGKLSGAILDVFDPEPLPAGHSLWGAPNVFISPHCSSDDNDEYMPMTLDRAFANAARLAGGRKLVNVVDPAIGY